jgi:hypothetical protein
MSTILRELKQAQAIRRDTLENKGRAIKEAREAKYDLSLARKDAIRTLLNKGTVQRYYNSVSYLAYAGLSICVANLPRWSRDDNVQSEAIKERLALSKEYKILMVKILEADSEIIRTSGNEDLARWFNLDMQKIQNM